jgi:O-antigen biosynthesis protein
MAVVCIAGMHRSGTSMVARMVNLCGLYLGDEDEFLPAAADNPKGFWENKNFLNINEKILSHFNGTWDAPPAFMENWHVSNELDKYREEAAQLIQSMSHHEHWGWKDPRTSLTLPFWQELIPDLKVIVCMRNPLEVAQSLESRNKFHHHKSMQLWLTYYEVLFADTPTENCLITHYSAYFHTPQTELQRLLKFIGLELNSVIIDQACAAATRTLRHNLATLEDLIHVGTPVQVLNTYAQFHSQKEQGGGTIENELLIGLKKQTPLLQSLAGALFEKEETILRLTASLKEKDQEISEKDQEILNRKAILKPFNDFLDTPPPILRVFATIWKAYKILIPQNSRRKKIVRLVIDGFVAIYRQWILNEPKYTNWVRKYDPIPIRDSAGITRNISLFEQKPLISVVMPVYNPQIEFLEEAIQSVRQQVYPHWEFCIADDNSPNPAVRELIEKHAVEDPRIRFVFRMENGHISASSNSALELAHGEYIALLDHDDLLHPMALYYTAEAVNQHPDAEIIYSDEDKLGVDGKRKDPYFKSDFNYDLFLSQNMISHLGIYRTDAIRRLGGFRLGTEGSQDYDLALRLLEIIQPNQVVHIPRVLYHWRVSEQSTASGADAKPYAYMAGMRAINEHLQRKGVKASVEFLPHISSYQVTYPSPQPQPSVDVVIAAQTYSKQLAACTEELLSRAGQDGYNVVIYLQEAKVDENPFPATLLQDPAVTGRAEMTNRVAAATNAEYLCLISEDALNFSEGWLQTLMGRAELPNTGIVSPLLLRDNGRIHSSGLILGQNGSLIRLFAGLHKDPVHYFGWAHLSRNFSALADGCLLVKREHLLEAGGLDETFNSFEYAIADLCLKLQTMGMLNVVIPQAQAYFSPPPFSFGWNKRLAKDKKQFQHRWKDLLQHDPAFNPNLDVKFGRVILSRKPRRSR